jgi:hypothetical protein
LLSAVACILTIYCLAYRLAGILRSRAILSEITVQQRPETSRSDVAIHNFSPPDRASPSFPGAPWKPGSVLLPAEPDSTAFNQQPSSVNPRLEARTAPRGRIAAHP